MKKIMLEVEVEDNFNSENLDVAYVVVAPIGIKSLEFRIIEPAVQAQGYEAKTIYRDALITIQNMEAKTTTVTAAVLCASHALDLAAYREKHSKAQGEPVAEVVEEIVDQIIDGYRTIKRVQLLKPLPIGTKLYEHPITDGSGRDTEILQFISDKFDAMKTSSSQTFVSLLGFNNENDYCEDLRELIGMAIATQPQSDTQKSVL